MDKTVEYFFDVGSPYSYLAARLVPAWSAKIGAPVRWRPFLLGAVFKASGGSMPSGPKLRYELHDLERLARHHKIPFKFNSRFPISTLSAQRALVAAGRIHGEQAIEPLAQSFFDGIWVENRDLADGDEVAFCAGRVQGIDVKKLAAQTQSQENKDALREITDEAIARGAFGAPTFFVGEAMFWGHDRLYLIEDELRG
jgi:2-hydroxychromene-2-carboxylate isomerase